MKVSEQISALEVMAVNPIRYLVSPRIFSGIIMLPALTIIADFLGIFGGYSMIGVHKMGLVSGVYLTNIETLMSSRDIFGGIIKSLFFGIIITSVACCPGGGVHPPEPRRLGLEPPPAARVRERRQPLAFAEHPRTWSV